MRHTPQSTLMDQNSNGSVHPHHQMNFDYNHQNGLELAGFCSPAGKPRFLTTKFLSKFIKTKVMISLGAASTLTSPSQGSIHSPQHVQSPIHNQTQSFYHIQQNQLTAGSSKPSFYQYLTPPSHNDSGNQTPQHMVQTLDSYPTPSPESPGHWSSSQSPHSISDWSDTHSPANQNHYVSNNTHQGNKGSEAIYI